MAIVVSLTSNKEGEIRKFLEKFYQKEINMDDDVDRWIYVYNKPLKSVDIISALLDNNESYQISLSIELDNGDIHNITDKNVDDVIKGLFCLFYERDAECTYL